MSIYDNSLMDSDLDAFKNVGVVQTVSIVISGNLAGGEQKNFTSTPLTATSPDFAQFLFDNSQKHSGKFKNIILEEVTMVYDSTSVNELTVEIGVVITGTQIYFTASMLNPYAATATLQTTTLNFRYIPYEATF